MRNTPDKLRVLIVEDQLFEAELMARPLGRRYDLAWTHVDNEQDYVKALEAPPDIVLSDYHMPQFSGRRALALLKQHRPGIPFILVTGSIGEESAVEMMRLGADDYLVKDRMERLAPAVEKALRETAERAARRKAERELEALREQLKTIVSALPDVVWSAAFPSSRMLYVSDASTAVFGWTPEDFYLGRTLWRDVIHPDDRACAMKKWEEAAQAEWYESEHRIVKPGGEVRWLQSRGRRSFDANGKERVDGIARDITERVATQRKLHHLAYYDPLTGLANRTLFFERLARRTGGQAAGKPQLALCIINVERFKTVNDAFGRQVGDALLMQVSERLREVAQDPDHLARLEADNFALIVPSSREQDVIGRLDLAHRLVDCDPYVVKGIELRIATRAGVALFPRDGTDAEALYRNAEAALKKSTSGERYLFYTQWMTDRIAEKLALEYKLRQALERDEFVLHYQPRADLHTGRIAGLEALIRWQSPELGLVPPLQFIPLMEDTGLIMQVGAWALERACLDHRGWLDRDPQAPRVAVNVSAIQLRQRDFVDVLKRAMVRGAAPPGIDLEITESAVMENVEANTAKLRAVRELGLNIAIDDFGTGYSSLGYLTRLPVHSLKIDRSFVIAMPDDPNALTLVSTIISLAHSLDLKVVAEGVETDEQAKMLRLFKCDEMQGYLVSKPVPAEEVQKLLCMSPAKA